MSYAFSKVGKPEMVLNGAEGRKSDGKNVFVRLLDNESYSRVLPFVFMPCIHLEKAEALYHRHRLGHCTTVLHGVAVRCSRILHRLFFCALSASSLHVS